MIADKAHWDLDRHYAMKEIYWSNPAKTILPRDHFAFYRTVAEHIGVNEEIDYLEFGVAHGKSIAEMSRLFYHDNARLFGFDSFVGLPERWLMHEAGAFSNRGLLPNISDKRVEFIKGWFQNTVPDFLAAFDKDIGRPTLIHFDADLYSSTLFLLAALWFKFDHYYFIMDDFIHDDVIALHHFALTFPVELEFHFQTTGGGQRPNPDQVFGHMRRRKFVVEGCRDA